MFQEVEMFAYSHAAKMFVGRKSAEWTRGKSATDVRAKSLLFTKFASVGHSFPGNKQFPNYLSLVATFFWGNFFFRDSKKVIFLSGQALTPTSILVARPLKKLLFATSLIVFAKLLIY